jgi:hypothetical protein
MSSVPALAQAPTTGQEAMAETFFQDGRKLMEEGRYAEACPKLAESQSIDPAGGTVLLLALCYEQVGKTASAWVKFNEALATARRDGREDREDRARRHIKKLEPMLSRITVSVPPEVSAQEGFVVELDGVVLPAVALARALPSDPGSHKIDVRAHNKRPWSTTVELGGKAAREVVTVPLLEDLAPTEPVSAPPQPAPRRPAAAPDAVTADSNSAPALAYVVGGLGILSTSVGGYFGIRALDRNADATDICPQSECTESDGVELNKDARTDAMRANVLMGAGLVLVGVGAYLWLSAPEDNGAGTAVVVRPDGLATGLSIGTETRW